MSRSMISGCGGDEDNFNGATLIICHTFHTAITILPRGGTGRQINKASEDGKHWSWQSISTVSKDSHHNTSVTNEPRASSHFNEVVDRSLFGLESWRSFQLFQSFNLICGVSLMGPPAGPRFSASHSPSEEQRAKEATCRGPHYSAIEYDR